MNRILTAFVLLVAARLGAAEDAAAPALRIKLISPLDFQVVQRSTRAGAGGSLIVAGSAVAESKSIVLPDELKVRVTGNSPFGTLPDGWRPLPCDSRVAAFRGELQLPAGGWYRLELQAFRQGVQVASAVVDHIGVGEVFVIAGQSNSANYGEERQNTKSGLVASFDGATWRLAQDPQPGAGGTKGSFMPLFGDEMAECFHVPIGVVAAGVGSTSVREWLPAGTRLKQLPPLTRNVVTTGKGQWEVSGQIFDKFTARLKQLGPKGFRAVLWHQGESDAQQANAERTLPGDLYRQYLEQLIRDSRQAIGWDAPWFVAQASYHNPTNASSPDIRAAQKAVWDDGLALPGPDTDTLTGELREKHGTGIHLSAKGLQAHAHLWVEKVSPWLEQQLGAAGPQHPAPAGAVTNAPAMPDAAATAVPGAHLDYPPGQPPKFWSIATAETIMARWPDYTKAYFNSWTYVNGYAFCAFERLGRDTGDPRYLDYIKRYVDQFVDEQGNFHSVTNQKGQLRPLIFNNLDNMVTGNSVVMLYERTRDDRYRKAADKIRRALDDYPRNRDGGFWHAKSLPGQMWIDGIFMGQMFLTRYGQSIGDADYCWNEAARQMTVYAKRAERDHTGLYVHGVYEPGHGDKPCHWADPKTGLSAEVWSEGLGWYALVLAETLATLPANDSRRPELEDIFRRLAAGLKRTQDAKTGRWFQVVDKGDRPDNWTDTSGSAMFTYALARGNELGLLDPKEYAPVVAAGYKGITAFARINDRGLVDIYQACDGVGVQTNYDRYIHYEQSTNAKEAVVGFLWAAEIVERSRLKSAK